jgi:hypothetical protein
VDPADGDVVAADADGGGDGDDVRRRQPAPCRVCTDRHCRRRRLRRPIREECPAVGRTSRALLPVDSPASSDEEILLSRNMHLFNFKKIDLQWCQKVSFSVNRRFR